MKRQRLAVTVTPPRHHDVPFYARAFRTIHAYRLTSIYVVSAMVVILLLARL